jgi:thioredoxin 1
MSASKPDRGRVRRSSALPAMSLLVMSLLATMPASALAAQIAAGAPAPATAPAPAPVAPASPAQAAAGDTAPHGELPFSKLSYVEARDAAKAQGKLFLVDATATWCGPCKQMERDTWPLAEVGAWVAAHAVAVQIDVDAQKDIAKELQIEAMPTIIVFRDGTELDRHTGLLESAELLTWLDDVVAGRAGTGPLLERGRSLLQSDDYKARYEIAKELQQHHEDDLAVQHYVWLWPHTRGTSFVGVRLSFMLGDMKRFADRSDVARAAFDKLFAEVRAAVADKADPGRSEWSEFSSWCDTFGHGDALRAWYDAHHGPDGSVSSALAAGSLFDAFAAQGEWALAGRLGPCEARAGEELDSMHQITAMLKLMGGGSGPDMKDFYEKRLRQKLSGLCAAAWAVGRDDEARGIADRLLHELDDGKSRLALATVTLAAVGVRPEQSAWLDEAAAKGGDADEIAALREKIAAAAAAVPATTVPLQPASPPEPVR